MRKKSKSFKVAAVIFGMLSLAGIFYSLVFPAITQLMLRNMLNEAGLRGADAVSVGVIGGADGPTSIFVASYYAPVKTAVKYIATGFLAAGTIVFFILSRKSKKQEEQQ